MGGVEYTNRKEWRTDGYTDDGQTNRSKYLCPHTIVAVAQERDKLFLYFTFVESLPLYLPNIYIWIHLFTAKSFRKIFTFQTIKRKKPWKKIHQDNKGRMAFSQSCDTISHHQPYTKYDLFGLHSWGIICNENFNQKEIKVRRKDWRTDINGRVVGQI